MKMWGFISALTVLAMLISASAALVLALLAVWRSRHRPQSNPSPESPFAPNCLSLWPEWWLAIKTRNQFAVQAALDLHNPRTCSWLEGFTEADQLFVAPPVRGWILVTGAGAPSPTEDVDACFRFVVGLSRKLGEVQFFSASRVLHHHAWVKARKGRIIRAYAWAGSTLWCQGSLTSAEKDLHLLCLEYGQPAPWTGAGPAETMARNTEKVALLAARWGLDPASVQQHFPRNERGIAGKSAHRY